MFLLCSRTNPTGRVHMEIEQDVAKHLAPSFFILAPIQQLRPLFGAIQSSWSSFSC